MKEIEVYVGTYADGGTVSHDTRRTVRFTGERLAQYVQYGLYLGKATDTCGTTQTLYRADDGRLIVHVEDWSKWKGEPTKYSLFAVTEADLKPGGRFELLGREAGFWSTLTLDDVLCPAYHGAAKEITE